MERSPDRGRTLMERSPDRGRTFVIAPFVLLTFFFLAMVSYNITEPRQVAADYTISQPGVDAPINAIYLVGTDAPTLDVVRLQGAGIRVVSTAAAAQDQVSAADAILIERSALALVAPDWLALQLREGKLIAALNVPIAQLGILAGYQAAPPQSLNNYLQDYGGRPFYSWFYQKTERSGVKRQGAGSDIIYSTEDFLGRLSAKSNNARAELNPPPLTPQPHPTRPKK